MHDRYIHILISAGVCLAMAATASRADAQGMSLCGRRAYPPAYAEVVPGSGNPILLRERHFRDVETEFRAGWLTLSEFRACRRRIFHTDALLSTEARLRDLEALRAKDLIPPTDYEQERAEIMRGL